METNSFSTPRSRTDGFTLIELLVVIAIIGVLAALILPAILASKEEARRTQCLNHLGQLGKAANGYMSTHGAYPPGYLGPDPPQNATSPYAHQFVGMHAFLLPLLGKDKLADQIDTDIGTNGVRMLDINASRPKWWGAATPGPTELVARQKLPEFLCPSAPNNQATQGVFTIHNTYLSGSGSSATPRLEMSAVAIGSERAEFLGITNYLGVAGAWGKNGTIDVPSQWDQFAGIFGNRTRTSVVRDGTSYTLLIGEATCSDGYNYSWMGAGCLPVGPRDGLLDQSSFTVKLNDPNHLRLFSSYHSGGIVQFCFADGSAKPISMAIGQDEFEAMAGANDGVAYDPSLAQ